MLLVSTNKKNFQANKLYRVFQEKCLFLKLNYAQKIKQLCKMLYIFVKTVLGHLCFKCLKFFYLNFCFQFLFQFLRLVIFLGVIFIWILLVPLPKIVQYFAESVKTQPLFGSAVSETHILLLLHCTKKSIDFFL